MTNAPARFAAMVVGALALALPGVAAADGFAQGAGEVIRVDLAGGGATQNLSLPRGQSAVIELPVDARDVLVSNPEVADVSLRSPRRIYIMGMKSGSTDAVFFDQTGRRILRVAIRVDTDVSALDDTLARVVGRGAVHAEPAGDNLVLTGTVANAQQSEMAERVARAFVAKPEMVINALSIAGSEQVMLKVRIVEVQRSAIKQLGVNMNAILNQVGEAQYLLGNAATYGINGTLLGGLTGGYSLDTTTQPIAAGPANCNQSFTGDRSNPAYCVGVGRAGSPGLNKAQSLIQAFERVGLVRTLAEPNLTAISGESANFLAGGEFPVPVAEDENGRITVVFKKFGVGLGFTPVVLSEGRISLRISTEVSELTNLGSFSAAGSGLSIPGLNVRRAETTVELPSGGALMMAGLMQSRSKQNLDKVPGLGSLPVLGALFRSRDFLNDETELVIIVTPYLVKPVHPGQLQTPADGIQIAHDARTVFLGKLNETWRPSGAAAPAAGAYQGPVGPVIE